MATAQDHLIDEAELNKLTVNYAIATDALGSGQPDRIASGRALYRRIFSTDACIEAGDSGQVAGPDAWADFVIDALEPFSTTQHLVGTISIQFATEGNQATGETAKMTTYLHATHEYQPGGDLWIVLGTYEDEAFKTDQGWRLVSRHLVVTSSEKRTHDSTQAESTLR